MADLSPTAASVALTGGSEDKQVVSGAAITAGDAVYKDTTDSSKAKGTDHTTTAKATIHGIALNSTPGADQPLSVATSGTVAGFGATEGTSYYLSANTGKICPDADVATGDYVTYVGVGTSTGALKLQFHITGIAKP